jgi:hypothetical protein
MSWTYSGNPANSDLDEVRFLIGDTLVDEPLLQDEEIKFFISKVKNASHAAIKCCEVIIANLSRSSDSKVGPIETKQSQQVDNYRKLLVQLRKSVGGTPTNVAGNDNHETIFNISMMDNR